MFTATDDHNHQMLQYYPPLNQFEPSIIMERRWKRNVEIAPNCPRCASINTKFCYYNNYSLSQPRYFCKGCRRYWTKGGSLRNVPVGGGCWKNRRVKSAKRDSENYNKSTLNDRAIASAKASCSDDDTSVGPNIDLEVVFAKFLDESSTSHVTDLELANTLNSTTPDSFIIGEANLNVLEEFPKVCFEQKDLLEDDLSSYGLPAPLSDEIADQDVLCSEQAETETFPQNTWQPMFQLQDFDYGQLKASANLIGNNWTSMDLSGSPWIFQDLRSIQDLDV